MGVSHPEFGHEIHGLTGGGIIKISGIFWGIIGLSLVATGAGRAQEDVAAIDRVIGRYVDHEMFNGSVSVTRSGQVIYQKGHGPANREWNQPNAPDTRYWIASLTKSFTAVLIMQLVEEGKLGLSDTIDRFIPEMPEETGRRITIRHLLTHTSGLPNYFEIPGWLTGNFRRDISEDEFLAVIANLELNFPPGEGRQYSNPGFFLLGRVIRSVTGQPYLEALRTRILDPLGMTATGGGDVGTILKNRADGYQWNDGGGYRKQGYIDISLFRASGDLYSTVDDLARWERALDSEDLLNEKSRAVMFDPETGFGWDIEQLRIAPGGPTVEVIGYNGQIEGYSSMVTRFVSEGHAVIILANTPMDYTTKKQLTAEIAGILYGVSAQAQKPRATFELTRALVDGDFSKAVEACRAEEGSFEFDEHRLNGFSGQLDRAGLPDQSLAILELRAEKFPSSAGALVRLAEAYRQRGMTREAMALIEKALVLLPDNEYLGQVLEDLAIELEEQG